MKGPGLARARSLLSEAQADEERAARRRREAERLIAAEDDDGLDARELDRRRIHASFCAAVQACRDLGWTYTRVAEVLGVTKATLGYWLDEPRRRDQLGYWLDSALDRLPPEARSAFEKTKREWRAPIVLRTGTND
jgi:DNA invertase Pin-like site-specific DNA recombinase